MTKAQKSELGRLLSSLRKHKNGGRKKVLRKCKLCGVKFGAREMLAHVPQCRKAMEVNQ